MWRLKFIRFIRIHFKVPDYSTKKKKDNNNSQNPSRRPPSIIISTNGIPNNDVRNDYKRRSFDLKNPQQEHSLPVPEIKRSENVKKGTGCCGRARKNKIEKKHIDRDYMTSSFGVDWDNENPSHDVRKESINGSEAAILNELHISSSRKDEIEGKWEHSQDISQNRSKYDSSATKTISSYFDSVGEAEKASQTSILSSEYGNKKNKNFKMSELTEELSGADDKASQTSKFQSRLSSSMQTIDMKSEMPYPFSTQSRNRRTIDENEQSKSGESNFSKLHHDDNECSKMSYNPSRNLTDERQTTEHGSKRTPSISKECIEFANYLSTNVFGYNCGPHYTTMQNLRRTSNIQGQPVGWVCVPFPVFANSDNLPNINIMNHPADNFFYHQAYAANFNRTIPIYPRNIFTPSFIRPPFCRHQPVFC